MAENSASVPSMRARCRLSVMNCEMRPAVLDAICSTKRNSPSATVTVATRRL